MDRYGAATRTTIPTGPSYALPLFPEHDATLQPYSNTSESQY